VVEDSYGVLKLESLQPTARSRSRGALAALESLAGPARAAGVVTGVGRQPRPGHRSSPRSA
jgi:hypothetical protein